jgi:hypothetical protein
MNDNHAAQTLLTINPPTEYTEDRYHQDTQASKLDVLNCVWPRLRQPRHFSHVPCANINDCHICRPLSQDTVEGLRGYAVKMYKLMTGKNAYEDTEAFNSNNWCLCIAKAVQCAGVPARDGGTVGIREKVQRLRTLALICDADHRPVYRVAATSYRAFCDNWEKERLATVPSGEDESRESAQSDLTRIRKCIETEWAAIKESMDYSRMHDLLYIATVWGVEEKDKYSPVRTDWWRASYKPGVTVPGINKDCNLIEITDDTVWLRVSKCSKEPGNSIDLNVTEDSPMLAEMLRAWQPIAQEKHGGFLFKPCKRTGHDARRSRASIKLLRPPGPCPHDGQCTRCHKTFRCGKNGKRECDCTDSGKRARPECGPWCGPACGHYTNIGARHKRVCTELGSRSERRDLAARMGTSESMLNRYGDGIGSV